MSSIALTRKISTIVGNTGDTGYHHFLFGFILAGILCGRAKNKRSRHQREATVVCFRKPRTDALEHFLKYVLIAALIALPLAWFSVHKWLQDYAYRIDIKGWIFVVAVLIANAHCVCYHNFQAIKAAIANPVKLLRTE